MVFNENENIRKYFIDYIIHTFKDLREGEFYSEFEKMSNVNFLVTAIISELDRMDDLIDNVNGPITKSFIKDMIKNHICNERTVFMSTKIYGQINDEGLMNLTDFKLVINAKMLYFDILDFITILDEYKEFLNLNIRHEIGHMIDKFNCLEGKPKSVSSDACKQIKIDYDNFYKTSGDLTGADYMRKYHNIPYERTADVLGRVDVEEMIRLFGYLTEYRKSNVGFEIKVIDKS